MYYLTGSLLIIFRFRIQIVTGHIYYIPSSFCFENTYHPFSMKTYSHISLNDYWTILRVPSLSNLRVPYALICIKYKDDVHRHRPTDTIWYNTHLINNDQEIDPNLP